MIASLRVTTDSAVRSHADPLEQSEEPALPPCNHPNDPWAHRKFWDRAQAALCQLDG